MEIDRGTNTNACEKTSTNAKTSLCKINIINGKQYDNVDEFYKVLKENSKKYN